MGAGVGDGEGRGVGVGFLCSSFGVSSCLGVGWCSGAGVQLINGSWVRLCGVEDGVGVGDGVRRCVAGFGFGVIELAGVGDSTVFISSRALRKACFFSSSVMPLLAGLGSRALTSQAVASSFKNLRTAGW